MVAEKFEKVSLQVTDMRGQPADLLQIAKAVDDEVVSRDLVPAFIKLLKDTEAEVRTAIAGQIPGVLCNVLVLVHSTWPPSNTLLQASVLLSNVILCSPRSCRPSKTWCQTHPSKSALHSATRSVVWLPS